MILSKFAQATDQMQFRQPPCKPRSHKAAAGYHRKECCIMTYHYSSTRSCPGQQALFRRSHRVTVQLPQ